MRYREDNKMIVMRHHSLFLLFLLSIMLLVSANAQARLWSYKDHGRSWTGLCQTGKRQSPIDISDAMKQTSFVSPHLYTELIENMIRQSSNHSLVFDTLEGKEAVKIDGDKGFCDYGNHHFEATEFHFHSPSEHTFNGKHFPLEMHIVHHDKAHNTAVIAVLFEESEQANPFLDRLNMSDNREQGRFIHPHKSMGLSFLNTPSSHYFVYDGSMTTPPCTEGVKWFVLTRRHPISPKQIQYWRAYDHTIKGSYRITQPFNFRILKSI